MTSLPTPPPAPSAIVVGRAMSEPDFFSWFESQENISFRKSQFGMHAGYLFTEVQSHPFVLELSKTLVVWDDECKRDNNYPLLMDAELPPFNRKSYDSFLNKIYRSCCVYNNKFPAAPDAGWITDANYLSVINDLVRNKISCKFIDGPRILSAKLVELAAKHGLRAEYSSRNYDDGYYAYHVYVYFPLIIDLGTSPAVTHEVAVEIQISTQLKEVMYEILHKFYADDRSKVFKDDWKWDLGSLKFKSGYLSHTLHMLEAMIVELRDEL